MTYAELVAAVQNYAENTFDYSTDPSIMDTFIQQAEQRIYNTVQFPSLRKNVTGVTTSGNKYLALPNDFLSAYSLAVETADGQEFLLNKDVNFIRQAYPKATDTATPKYYALFGPATTSNVPPTITDELTIILGPTPDANYDVELHYYYYPTSIVTAGTSWLGDNLDAVLLYGTLVEAYTYMKGEADMMALYNNKYQEAIGMAIRLGAGLERSDAYRSGQFRVPPLPQNNGVK